MFLASKMFKIKKKGVGDAVLTSNILFKSIWKIGWVKPDCKTVMSVEASTDGKTTDS